MKFASSKTEKYYSEKIATQGAMLFSLIDPDKLALEAGARIAKQSYEGGADAILVGGSIGVQGSILDETVKMIKESAPGLPVVLYPGSPGGLTPYADAVYFMQMLNSRDVYWLSTAQIQAAPVVARMKLEAIPTTYLVIEPGRAVGWIGNANLVPRDRPDLAAACALAARYTGSHVLITDAGSGAPSPVPELIGMIREISKVCNGEMFYFYAGGVRTAEDAAQVINAGARGIHVGNAFEEEAAFKKIKEISAAIRKEGKKRV
ncbi:geranylgeranylglyceryl/heptaprenylglyceryl phosphate synthase [Candidatus Micrarchaeota archaeon]|nr:geranylgeranylglyceryl/heptaprenylglyceryl phosphate synthase [Candidatus Micrarchaeota archaeon]